MRSRSVLAILAMSAPLLVGGCIIPPALTIASYAVDGVSYVASGKSVEDHALSMVAGQDCALHRVLQDKEICSDYAPEPVLADGGESNAADAPATFPVATAELVGAH